jgi:hypothetical protein
MARHGNEYTRNTNQQTMPTKNIGKRNYENMGSRGQD